MKHFKLILSLIGVILYTSCEKKLIVANGYLKGKISIGPICPVERNPPDTSCMPTAETYKAYSVGIWTSDGMHNITQLSPSLNGSYITELATGNYLVRLENNQSIATGSNLPVHIVINALDSTLLDINIDTGIR